MRNRYFAATFVWQEKEAPANNRSRKTFFITTAFAGVIVLAAIMYQRARNTDSDYLYVTFRCLDKRCNKGT